MLKIDHPPLDYRPVLRMLGLSCFADRRVRANLEFLQRLIGGSMHAPALLSQMNIKIPSRCRRFRVSFVVPMCIVPTTNDGRNQPIDKQIRQFSKDSKMLHILFVITIIFMVKI